MFARRLGLKDERMRAAANHSTFSDQQSAILRLKKDKMGDRKETKKLIEIGDQLTTERDETHRKYNEAMENSKALKVLADAHTFSTRPSISRRASSRRRILRRSLSG